MEVTMRNWAKQDFTKCCRMTITSYTAQLWTPCVYTRQRLILTSDSAIHKNNKAPKTEINKALRLVKQVLLLAAGCNSCVCVNVWVHACVQHFHNEWKSWQRAFTFFLFEIYIDCTTAEVKLISPWSRCVPIQNDLSCVSVFLSLFYCVLVWEKGSMCMSAYWVIYRDGWGLAKEDKSGERQASIMCFRGFSVSVT